MAAIAASKKGKQVVLMEKNSEIGRKILATGNGRCNITNKNVTADRFYGADDKFVNGVLSQFDQHKTMDFFNELGLLLKEEDRGRIFPRTNQASSVINVLLDQLNERKVTILVDSLVKKIEKKEAWNVILESRDVINAKKLIITTGGKAAHFLGSSGDGLFWARNLGHTITPIYAALVPVETKESWVREVQGVKVEAKVWAAKREKIIAHKYGDLLFTHFGLSGPSIMSMARKIAPEIGDSKVELHIDLFPEIEKDKLAKSILKSLELNGKKAIKNALVGILPQRLIEVILALSDIDVNKKSAEISKVERENILLNMKNLTLTVSGLRPLKEAQVTAGGIETSEINTKTLESKIVKDLYFAGEIIDVDGDSGGFNLQWAWSSGYVAGKNASF
ncbi:MAG: NAD(P)/FAD-dependent oxidoreductase [Patescibacteria group bacterium]|nr:NAD(P)/FAD-dependent oxidoreductase [Patescibacteria group bacterium]